MKICHKNRKRHKDGEAGQSIVEMAIALPILLLLLVAVIDFARIIDAGIILTNAAREGARYGSLDPGLTESDIQDLVVGDVLGSGSNVTVMSDFSSSNVTVEIGEDVVTVSLTYNFELWFGGIANRDSVTLTRVAVMPVF